MRCDHRRTWLIGGVEWCYECGAIRHTVSVPDRNAVAPYTTWVRPIGIGGPNPYQNMKRLEKRHGDEERSGSSE